MKKKILVSVSSLMCLSLSVSQISSAAVHRPEQRDDAELTAEKQVAAIQVEESAAAGVVAKPVDRIAAWIEYRKRSAPKSIFNIPKALPVHKAFAKPKIVSRAAWGADEARTNYWMGQGIPEADRHLIEYRPVTHIVVHHTAGEVGNACDRGEVEAILIRNIHRYHADVKKWGDIGYNLLIGPSGTIFEGARGNGNVLEDGVVAAHALGYNYRTIGVVLLGNFNDYAPSNAAYQSLIDSLAYACWYHKINPLATADLVRDYDTKWDKLEPNIPTIQGHGLLPRAATNCPGRQVRASLPQIRLDVAKMLKGFSPRF